MKTFLAVNRMYQCFTCEPDLFDATQGAATVFAQATTNLHGAALQRQSSKICEAARYEPHTRFGEFVKNIAQHAAAPQPQGLHQGMPRPLDPIVLKRETMQEQLVRRFDIQGKAISQACIDLVAEGADVQDMQGTYGPEVVARVRQRLVDETTRAGAGRALKKLFDTLHARGMSNEALDKAIKWLAYPAASVDLPGLTSSFKAIEARLKKDTEQGSMARPQRSRKQVAEAAHARPLLRFLGALNPQEVPCYEHTPGLEDEFCIFLHEVWLPSEEPFMRDVHRAVHLVELLERYAQQGETAIDALRWPIMEKQAAVCLCLISEHIHRWRLQWQVRGRELARQENLARLGRKIAKARAVNSSEHLTMLQQRARVLSAEENRDAEALTDLDAVVHKRPTPSALIERAIVRANLGDFCGAQRDATAADTLISGDETGEHDGVDRLKLYALRGSVRLRLSQNIDALSDLLKVRMLSPSRPYTELLDDLERAMATAHSKELMQLGQCSSGQLRHWVALQQARTQLVIGNYPEAKEAFEKTLAERPDCAESKAGIAVALDLQKFSLQVPASLLQDAELTPLVGLEGMRVEDVQALFEQLSQAPEPQFMPTVAE